MSRHSHTPGRQKVKNARKSLLNLEGLPKPDLAGFAGADIAALIADLGTPEEPPGRKKGADQATGLAGEPHKLVRKTGRKMFLELATSKRAVAAIGRLPLEDETFHCLMGGDYHGFDLIIAIQQLAAAPIDELHVTTLGFNRHNMAHLCAMVDSGRVGHVSLMCSDYFAGADADTFNAARAEFRARGHRLISARNHSKILLFAIGARRYVVESSANLRSCHNLEQFSLCQSAELHAFHRGWILKVFDHAAG